MIRSIRFTLTLWYVGILTVILSLFAWILYTKVSSNLIKDVDQILILEANGTADSIFAFWQAKWEDEHKESLADQRESATEDFREIEKEAASGRLSQFLKRWSEDLIEVDPVHAVQIIDRNGVPLFATKTFEHFKIPLTDNALENARRGRVVFESFDVPQHARSVLCPMIENGEVLYFVQSVVDLKQTNSSLANLKLWIFWLIPLTLSFATVVGWFFATLAFKPIRNLIKQAKSISAQDLHERVLVPKTGDEIEELGTTFNDMLGRLEHTFKRLRQFSVATSHELRTPLTIMKGELEVALRTTRETREYQRVLAAQLESLNDLIDIVEQLLALARSGGGKESMEWRPIELSETAEQVVHDLEQMIQDKNIGIEFAKHDPVWIRGEKPLVQSVISNLLNNALKHTPFGGRIQIRTSAKNEEAVFAIEDSGPGISKEEQNNIFDKFFAKPPEPTSSSTGIGLGLCRWIVEAHQGRIEMISEPGKGACFKVFFPLH